MKIGVLALQGAFIEHINILKKTINNNDSYKNCKLVEIRQLKDLEGINALVLPGGESTVQGKLLHDLALFDPIKELIEAGMPVLATCAGLILLSSEIAEDETKHLGTLPVVVKRNAYGRQLGSFISHTNVGDIKDYPLCFIRAPYIQEVLSPDVKVLCKVDDRIVAVKYQNQIGLAFHPEMTKDNRIHEEFLKLVLENCKNKTSTKLAS